MTRQLIGGVVLGVLLLAAPAFGQVPNRFDVVQAVNAAHPHLIRENSTEAVREFLWRTVAALAAADPRFGFLSKLPAENGIDIPGAGRVSIDAIAYQGEHNVVDIISSAGDGPGTGGIGWGETHERRPSSVWVPAVPFPGASIPDPEPDPPASELLRQMLHALADAENALRAELKAMRQELAEIKARPAPAYTGSLRLFGTTVPVELRPR